MIVRSVNPNNAPTSRHQEHVNKIIKYTEKCKIKITQAKNQVFVYTLEKKC